MTLARTLKQLRRREVRITAVIVSSIGVIYNQLLKEQQKVLGCTDRKMKKLGRRMSEAMSMGSMEIWRQNAREIRRGDDEDANALVAEEIDLLEAEAARNEAEAEARRRDDQNQDLEMEMDTEKEKEKKKEKARKEPKTVNQIRKTILNRKTGWKFPIRL
jgi:hypothetical protein